MPQKLLFLMLEKLSIGALLSFAAAFDFAVVLLYISVCQQP